MDYSANVWAIISSFYLGTGGLDIGLGHSCLGIKGGKNWEKTFTCHSLTVRTAILNVVNKVIAEGLREEINLAIKDELVEKNYSTSEIVSLTQKYHKGIKTGINEVDNVLISISFDMGWQKKGTGHTYNSNSGHSYFIGCQMGKLCVCLYTLRSAQNVTLQLQWARQQWNMTIAHAITALDRVRPWKLVLHLRWFFNFMMLV